MLLKRNTLSQSSYISALSTAIPDHHLDQKMVSDAMTKRLGLPPEIADKLKLIYQQTAIKSRYTVIKDFLGPSSERFFCRHRFPKMKERNELYKQYALPLAEKAVGQVLKSWGENPKTLTHIISVSCTGVFAPGLEFSLAQSFELSPQIQRLGINFMGCFGAFRAIAAAKAFALENPSHRILVICTELCSLHFQPKHDWDTLIANALFGDGAAAIIVESKPENPLFEIIEKSSITIPDSFENMQWEASDEGLLMKLSSKVPEKFTYMIPEFIRHLLGDKFAIEDCDWPIHPGGKAILEQIEHVLGLKPNQTIASWEVLKNYGNMSSVTFLFVLQQLLKISSVKRKEWAVGLGFGPGLSIEGLILRQCDVDV